MTLVKLISKPKHSTWSGKTQFPKTHDDIAPYFTKYGGIYTGLTDADAKALGKQLNVDLASTSEFWTNFFIRKSDKDLYLDIENSPMDKLKYLFLKGHKRVSNGLLDTTKSNTDYILLNELDEAKKNEVMINIKTKAISSYNNMNDIERKQALRLYGLKSEGVEQSVINQKLFNLIEADPEKFLDIWVDNSDRELEAFVHDCVGYGIIIKSKGNLSYNGSVLGSTAKEVALHISEPKNADLKSSLAKQLDIAKGKK